MSFENTVGKGEIAHDEQFLFFHSVFYPFKKLLFSSNLKLLTTNSSNLEKSKSCHLGKSQLISTKLGRNVYDHKNSDEFDFGTNQTRNV